MNHRIVLFFALFLLVPGLVIAAPDLTTGLQNYWSMDDATDSEGGRTLSVNGATNTGTNCFAGTCYSFDGTNDWLNTTSYQEATGDFTVRLYAYDSDWNDGTTRALIDTDNVGEHFYIADFNTLAGVTAQVNDGVDQVTATTPSAPSVGLHAFHLVWDDSAKNLSIYLDGVRVQSTVNLNIDITNIASELWFGAFTTSSAYFDGTIDEAALWTRALNESTVNYDYAYGCTYTNMTSDGCVVVAAGNMTFTASSVENATLTYNVTATAADGSETYTYSLRTGTVVTDILTNSTKLWNFTTSADYHFTHIKDGANVSSNQSVTLTRWPDITATDTYSGSTVNTFYAAVQDPLAVCGGGCSLPANPGAFDYYNTTDGVIYLSINDSASLPYYVWSNTHFNKTGAFQFLDSADLSVSLYESVVTFYAQNRVSGANITEFNVTAGTASNTTSATNPSLFLTATNGWTATFQKYGYYPSTTEFNTTALTEQNETFSVYDHQLNITIDVLAGSASESTFNVTIYSLDHSFSENLATTTGAIIANLTDGDYTVWVNDSIHALISENITLSPSNNLTNLTIDVYTTNSVNFTFRDEQSNEVITGVNITAFLTSDVVSYEFTTSNGTYYAEMISPQSYSVTYDAEGYTQRQYFFTLTNRTTNDITLYLINETESTRIFTNVVDTLGDTIPGAEVRAYKKNLSGTDYYQVDSCTTDTNGECLLYLELYDVTYRFSVYNSSGSAYSFASNDATVTEDQVIKSTTLSLVVVDTPDELETIEALFGVSGAVTYNNNTETFTFTWDGTGLVLQACLETYRLNGVYRTDINESCTSSASGALTQTINESTGSEFVAIGKVRYDTSEPYYILDTYTLSTGGLGIALGAMGLFIFGFLVLGTLAFSGLWHPVGAPLVLGLGVLIIQKIGIITVGQSYAAGLAVLAGIIIYMVKS